MDEGRFLRWLVSILLVAAALRLTGVSWDGGIAAHPDERYLVGVAEGLRWFDRLNPFALAPHFPYGHLPLYLLALVGGRNRLMAARLLTGLVDTGTVALTASLGRRMGGGWTGLVAGGFLAVMPLHVQQAHFGTVDPFLAFFITGTLLFAARWAERTRWRDAALSGGWAGLAVGCKIGAALLALPLAAAWGLGWRGRREGVGQGMGAVGAALLGFGLTNPFALLDAPTFLSVLKAQAALVGGAAWAPYTLQYHDAFPYLYPIGQQLIWGMGPVLGALCFGGLAAALVRGVRRPPAPVGWVGLAWALPFFAFVGGLFVKFPRYLLSLTPVLAIYGAQGVEGVDRWRRWFGYGVLGLALLPAGLLSLALVASYARPHPWVRASDWLRSHVEAGSVIGVEAWDHPLPLDSSGYQLRLLPVWQEETVGKWERMEEVLATADVLVIASRRGYGTLASWPGRFPRTASFYQALLAEERGFQVVACFSRWPRVGPLALADDPFGAVGLSAPGESCRPAGPVLWLPPLDESFVVYDHPLVLILRRNCKKLHPI